MVEPLLGALPQLDLLNSNDINKAILEQELPYPSIQETNEKPMPNSEEMLLSTTAAVGELLFALCLDRED